MPPLKRLKNKGFVLLYLLRLVLQPNAVENISIIISSTGLHLLENYIFSGQHTFHLNHQNGKIFSS